MNQQRETLLICTAGQAGIQDCGASNNVGSFGKDGRNEAVRQNREVYPKHLDIAKWNDCPYMTMF